MNKNSEKSLGLFSDFVRSLHNQQETLVFPELKQVLGLSQTQFTYLSLVNLEINNTLEQLPSYKMPHYFQSQSEVISPILRTIGQIVKLISLFCKFPSKKESLLARFDTTGFYQEFYRECDQNNKNTLLLDFCKGIFPRMNVHKDNFPHYMPFYSKLQNYDGFKIGNDNWQMSRKHFNYIYETQISQTTNQKDHWYMILMGDRNLIQKYSKSSMQIAWAFLYYFYVQQTLRPYRNMVASHTDKEKEITGKNIILTLRQRLSNQMDEEAMIMLCLVLFSLTNDVDFLVIVVNKFLPSNKNMEGQKNNYAFRGLMIAMLYQLLNNLRELEMDKPMRDQRKILQLQTQMNTIQFYANLLASGRVPYHDFFLRIIFPSYTNNPSIPDQNQIKILNILSEQLQKDLPQQPYPYPSYPYFQKQFYDHFSENYLLRHPEYITDIAEYFSPQISVWKLLKTPKIMEKQSFDQIEHLLTKHKTKYIEAIKEKVQIQVQDYDKFIRGWKIFHQALQSNELRIKSSNLKEFLKKVSFYKDALFRLSQLKIAKEFRKEVNWIMDHGEGIIQLLDFMIQGIEEISLEINQEQREELNRKYQQFLSNPKFKSHIYSALRQEQKDIFWKKWTIVYLEDENLVKDLLGVVQRKIDQSQLGIKGQSIKSKQTDQKHQGLLNTRKEKNQKKVMIQIQQ